jgi:hypothetical protein
MDIAATRIDAKSAIYLDNMRQSVQREGEIFLSMAREVYYEPERVVETMTDDGDDGEAVLHEPFTDATGTFRIRNDFATGKYKVIADVTEATATRRDKTVKSSLATANVAITAQDMELAQIGILTAVMNQDGEGMADFQKYASKRLVAMGVVEPSDEEKAAMEQAAEADAQQPDPAMILTEAQASALKGSAMKDAAQAQKIMAEIVTEKLQPLIDGFNAETNRIKAFMGKGAPVGDISAKLQPLIDQAIREAIGSPDVLPGEEQRPRIRRGSEFTDEELATAA